MQICINFVNIIKIRKNVSIYLNTAAPVNRLFTDNKYLLKIN